MTAARLSTGFAAGVLFALGLGTARATRPEVVRGFLDFAGAWDPTLAVMMATAVTTYGVLYALARRRSRPVLAAAFLWPGPEAPIGARLVIGASVFGVGWGLVGLCPGPALTSALWNGSVLLFLGSMMGGLAAPAVAAKLAAVKGRMPAPPLPTPEEEDRPRAPRGL